ncbi:antibiotic biosynthesis monooxygenase family protein [Desulfobacter curvatus]|uniref:antibiotic biosynthesis monooxygenase family protein n=1 Tax=Desulfobacter curvatus TaxID=2290 RepID=UPI0003755EE1|nr:antibiotic biosynthesis monooxygenase family protein [Desulfobacter curvatus]
MAIKVFIKRICEDAGKEKELISLVRKIRTIVPLQPGYLSSRYVKKIDPPKDIVAISTWDSLEDWQKWYESEERSDVQSKIDAIPGVKTVYEIYEDAKTDI